MQSPEKIMLAMCAVSAIFLSTNLMLILLLRGRRDRSDSGGLKAAQGLLRRPHSRDAHLERNFRDALRGSDRKGARQNVRADRGISPERIPAYNPHTKNPHRFQQLLIPVGYL